MRDHNRRPVGQVKLVPGVVNRDDEHIEILYGEHDKREASGFVPAAASTHGNIDWFRSAFWQHLVGLDDAKNGIHTRLPEHDYHASTSRRLPMPDNLMADVRKVDWGAVVDHARIWVGPKAANNLDDRVSFLMGKRELFDVHDKEFQTKYRPDRARARGHGFVHGEER